VANVFRSKSDTEVLLAGLIEWDKACLNKLDGMFAFAWWTADRQSLLPLVTISGSSHFTMRKREADSFRRPRSRLWCSVHSSKWRGMRPLSAIHRGSCCRRIPASRDQEAPPAHCLVYDDGRTETRPYWRIEPNRAASDDREARETIGTLIERAVQMQMISDRPIGTFLSGGLDHRCEAPHAKYHGDSRRLSRSSSHRRTEFEQHPRLV